MSTTSWTDEEYSAVAVALLYPGGRMATFIIGFSPAVALGWELDGRLQQLGESAKQQALNLARQINAAESSLLIGALGAEDSCGGLGAVLRVGDITLDPRLGRTERQTLITRARARLAALVDFWINPNVNLDSGGINGTCSP